MNPSRSSNERSHVKDLLLRALEEPEETQFSFVRSFPGISDAVKAEVEDLLGAAVAEARPSIDILLLSGPLGEPSAPPEKIGPYRILEILARGGTSTVYLAKREDDHSSGRLVALKTLAYGRDSAKALERFRREIKALARLEHPSIVRLHDGGLTPDGLLYLAVEYVEGVHLDAYCREHRPALTDQLRLFERVCQGVAYANLNLIVHRDLKPSNILVNASGEPKILDFGIAKLFGESDDAAATTRSLTLKYSSPEQVQGSNISIASDVYSLGVVLYELLVEQSPYRSDERDLEGLTRDIVRNDPILPRAVRPSLPRDLEAIMLKALCKTPGNRYRSVDALIAELNRFLAGEPVEAHRGGAAYRASKWIKVHRVALAISSAFAVVVIAGALVSYRYARDADRILRQTVYLATDLASQMSEFNNGRDRASLLLTVGRTKARVLEIADSASGNQELLRQLLAALLEIGELQGYPDRQNLGDPAAATATFESGVALAERLVRSYPKATENVVHLGRAHGALGTMHLDGGRLEQALGHYQKAVDLTAPVGSGDPLPGLRAAARLSSQMYVAEVLLRLERIEEAVNMRREIVARRRELVRTDPGQPGHGQTLPGDIQTFGDTLRQAKQYDEALGAFAEVENLALDLLKLASNNIEIRLLLAQNRGLVALVHMDRHNYAEAEKEFVAACARYREIEKLHPVGTSGVRGLNRCTSWLSLAQKKAGKPALARENARKAIEGGEALVKASPGSAELIKDLRRIRLRVAK